MKKEMAATRELRPLALPSHALPVQASALSQAELANRMGVDRAYVSGLELGERNPTVITLWHVAQALGVKIDALLKDSARPRKPK
jgi:transcriptional regulator with XRE-family HTH domain